MMLAIHDLALLGSWHREGIPRSWAERGIRPWVVRSQFYGRAGLAELEREIPLEILSVNPGEAAFYGLFRERLRRVSDREATFLYLAEQTNSVVLTGEPMVAEIARGLDLRVCFGSLEELDQYFPLPVGCNSTENFSPAGNSLPAARIVQDLCERLAPQANPSPRRVPVRDEPASSTPAPQPAGRRDLAERPAARTSNTN